MFIKHRMFIKKSEKKNTNINFIFYYKECLFSAHFSQCQKQTAQIKNFQIKHGYTVLLRVISNIYQIGNERRIDRDLFSSFEHRKVIKRARVPFHI